MAAASAVRLPTNGCRIVFSLGQTCSVEAFLVGDQARGRAPTDCARAATGATVSLCGRFPTTLIGPQAQCAARASGAGKRRYASRQPGRDPFLDVVRPDHAGEAARLDRQPLVD